MLEKSGDEEAKKRLSEHECGGHSRCAAATLHTARLGEVRRSSGASSPDGEAQAMGENGKGRKSSVCAKKWRRRRKEEEGAVPPFIGEGVSGPATVGPRRFAPWAATWREDTRAKNKKPQARRTDPERQPGSGMPHLIRAQKPKGSDP